MTFPIFTGKTAERCVDLTTEDQTIWNIVGQLCNLAITIHSLLQPYLTNKRVSGSFLLAKNGDTSVQQINKTDQVTVQTVLLQHISSE